MTEIESYNCKECGCPLFYFFSVEKEINTLCQKCGFIVTLEELKSELRDAKIMGLNYTELGKGSKRRE